MLGTEGPAGRAYGWDGGWWKCRACIVYQWPPADHHIVGLDGCCANVPESLHFFLALTAWVVVFPCGNCVASPHAASGDWRAGRRGTCWSQHGGTCEEARRR